MIRLPILSALVLATIAACTAGSPAPDPATRAIISSGEPLDTLPSGADLATVRTDLLTTAVDRFGSDAVNEALAAPAYIIAKRFAGMVPPPPLGEELKPPPTPTALLMKSGSRWMVATASGWRPAQAEAVADIDATLADPTFWNADPYTPPCPDYGAGLLLAKVPGKTETARNSLCMSEAETIVSSALRA